MTDPYEEELKNFEHSGPHPIDDERRDKNREVRAMIKDILPIDDIHKISDCDLIFKFLIARRWDAEAAAKGLREYAAWRVENNMNEILWEKMPEETNALACEFRGFDRYGHPVFYDRPDPATIKALLGKFDRSTLLRTHYKVMEWGRRLSKQHRTDRVSCVLDLSLLTMAIVVNPSAVGFLKEMAHMDQTMYPENMRTMLICNGGWSFNTIWKVIKPLLDERVQKKIQFMSVNNMAADIEKWIDLNQVPIKFGGSDISNPRLDEDSSLQKVEKFSPPIVEKSPEELAREAASTTTMKERKLVPEALTMENEDSNAPPAGSPVLDGAEYDSDDFHSIPTSDDEQEEVFVPPSPNAIPKEVRQKVSAPLGEVISGVIQMVVASELTPSGARGSSCTVDGVRVMETSGNVIVSAEGQLKGEVLAESGHPLHTYLLITDDKRDVKFILKRRNLHKKIHIYSVTGDTKVNTTKKMKHTCKGDRTHVMTCRQGTHSQDKRDWCIWPEALATKKCQAEKRGDIIVFHDQLPQYDMSVLFALAVGCSELWHFQE